MRPALPTVLGIAQQSGSSCRLAEASATRTVLMDQGRVWCGRRVLAGTPRRLTAAALPAGPRPPPGRGVVHCVAGCGVYSTPFHRPLRVALQPPPSPRRTWTPAFPGIEQDNRLQVGPAGEGESRRRTHGSRRVRLRPSGHSGPALSCERPATRTRTRPDSRESGAGASILG
jgi:hypothetical protein